MHMLGKIPGAPCISVAELAKQSRHRHAVIPPEAANSRRAFDLNFQRCTWKWRALQSGDHNPKAARTFANAPSDQQPSRGIAAVVGKQPPRVTVFDKACEQGAVKDAGGAMGYLEK